MAKLADYKSAADELVGFIAKIAEIRRAPKSAPDNNDAYPFAVLQPLSGIYTGLSRGQMIGLHNVSIELHVKKYELDRAQDQLKDMLDLIPKQCILQLQTQQFQFVQTWERIEYLAGPLEWAGVPTLGVIYTFINLKVISGVP